MKKKKVCSTLKLSQRVYKGDFSSHVFAITDVLNNSFWKMYIKPINDLDPGLNLLEKFFVLYCIVSNNVLRSNMLCIGFNFKH